MFALPFTPRVVPGVGWAGVFFFLMAYSVAKRAHVKAMTRINKRCQQYGAREKDISGPQFSYFEMSFYFGKYNTLFMLRTFRVHRKDL